jgi:hypothetical protein
MKILIMMLAVVLAIGAQAHSSCNINVDAGVNISSKAIEFYQDDRLAYRIINDRQLEVAGALVVLTSAQQQRVTQYAQQIRALVPEVHGIAIEGVNMAIDSVSLVFDGLLGDGNKVSRQLRSELTSLRGDVEHYFTSENTIHFNQPGTKSSEFLGKYFETRVERIVETSIQDSIGSLMIAMGKEMLTSGGDMEAFEKRMNRFGDDIEAQMASRCAKMETRADELCQSVVVVDALEEQLREEVPAVRPFNLLKVTRDDVSANNNASVNRDAEARRI